MKATPEDPGIGANFIPKVLALILAVLCTAVSLAIAVLAARQQSGTGWEKMLVIAFFMIAVVGAHWLPTISRLILPRARIIVVILWMIALSVVLMGQADVFAFAQQHAADQRAQGVSATLPVDTPSPNGRSRTAIAQNIDKVTDKLAELDARGCVIACRSWRARKTTLLAQLAFLNIEAEEAQRREVEADRAQRQADRIEQLRESRRIDPVSAQVARWVGTTETGLAIMRTVACSVVLEGMACLCWWIVGIPAVVSSRATVASSEHAVEAAAIQAEEGRNETVATIQEPVPPPTAQPCPTSAISNDDSRLREIRQAVQSGQLNNPPTQASIRELMGCQQKTAQHLNRLYKAIYGELAGAGGSA